MTHHAATATTATSFHTDAHATTGSPALGSEHGGKWERDRLSRAEWATTVNSTIQGEGFNRESGSKIPTTSEKGVLTGGVTG